MLLKRSGWDWGSSCGSRWGSMHNAIHDAGRPRHFFAPGERLDRKFNANILRLNVASAASTAVSIPPPSKAPTSTAASANSRSISATPPSRPQPRSHRLYQRVPSAPSNCARVPANPKVVVHGTAVFVAKPCPRAPPPASTRPPSSFAATLAAGAVEIEN